MKSAMHLERNMMSGHRTAISVGDKKQKYYVNEIDQTFLQTKLHIYIHSYMNRHV